MNLPLKQPQLIAFEPPPAYQVAQVNRALQRGRAADWIMERLNGIEARHALTDALQSAVHYVDPKGHVSSFMGKDCKKGETPEGQFIEAETNYIYGKLGISRAARKAIQQGVKRDHFDTAQLHALGLDHQWTRDKIKQVRTEMLNRLASVQQFMQELTGESA